MPAFAALFGAPPEATGEAPGRVNLIGEHTDYHGGYVLPAPLPLSTRVELRARADGRVRVWTAASPDAMAEYRLGGEAPRGDWLDYVQGVTHALREEGFELDGADMRIASDVPLGSGLSSSAALEISLLRALRQRFALPLDDVALARIGHRAETRFVGAPVGVMDQFVSSVGRLGAALFLDTRALAFEHLPLPSSLELGVIDSGLKHQHAGGEYGTRRAESFDAAARLGVNTLRDVDPSSSPDIAALPPPLDRRGRHVVTENARVLRFVEALRHGHLEELGRLLNESHASLRDDYEVSTPELDTLVALAQAEPAVFGARLTGGGFGGCVLFIARPGTASGVAARVLERYRTSTGRTGTRVMPR